MWNTDEELFRLAHEELFTAVVGDVMDKMGFQHQFLPPHIRPLDNDMVIVGRAMPVLVTDVFAESFVGSANSLMEKPFGLMLEALDNLKPHEVYVCTGGSLCYSLWGELMSTRAIQLGAAGAIVNGYSRDTKGILKLNFPTFSYGSFAQDIGPRGKVVDFRIPIEIDQVHISPGSIIFGDIDGVCVVPQEVEQDVFTAALEKARGEKLVKKAIEGGMRASDAFAQFGIM